MSKEARLLGRSSELGQLETLLGHVRNGQGAALLLEGEPGIGKTALMDAATSRAGGMRVLRADGYEAESNIPYAPLQRLLIPLRRTSRRCRSGSAAPCGWQPALPRAHHRTDSSSAWACSGLLAAAGEDQAVVCAVDDAHLR